MADRISVECPGCLAKVTLPDSSKLGKKVKCPKCSDVFVAEAADDEDSDEADDDAPAQSKGRKRPSAAPTPAKGGKKRKSSGNSGGGGGSNGPLIAGGAVAAVALLGVGLWLSGIFSSKPAPAPPIAQPQPVAAAPMVAHAPLAPPAPPAISPTERMLALRWLPQDTELIFHAKVADLWQAPLLKSLVESPSAAPGIKDFQSATGLLPTDVESVTVGITDSQQMQNVMASSMMGMPPKPPKAVAIVRTKKPVSMEEILKSAPELKSAEYKSKKYVESTTDEYCGWLADSSTLILAKSDDMKTIMDRGETVTPRKELMFADATPHLVVVLAPKNPKMLAGGPTAPGTSPEIGAMQKTMGESLTSVSLGVNIRGGFDVQTSFLLRDAQGTTAVKTGMEAGLVDVRKAFDAFKMSGQPLLVELGEQLLNNLKIETKDQVVKLTTSLPDSDQQKIEQLPPLLMMMAMTGGMGGGGPLAGPPNTMSGPNGVGQPSFNLPTTQDQKNPGETDPVDAESADGLPEGTTLSAMASWSHFPTLNAGQKSSHPMQLIFDLKGDNLREICGYGQVTLKTTVAGGGTLRVSKTQSWVHANVVKMIVPFELDAGSRRDHPEGTLRMIVLVDQSGAAANMVTAIEGTFKFLTAEETEEFTIEEAPKTAKRPLTDPGLKAAGMKLVKSNDVSGEVLTLSCGKGFFLGPFTASDQAAGVELISHAEVEKNQTVQKLASGPNGKFSPELSLQGKVYKGVKEKTVTFKFGEVALPTAETRPVPPQDNLLQQPNGGGFNGQPQPGQPQPGQPQPGQP
jgi:hypothetical protein